MKNNSGRHSAFYIISQLLRGHWLIDPAHAQGLMPLVQSYLSGEPNSFFFLGEDQEKELDPVAFSGSLEERTYYTSFDEAPKGSVHMLRVEGGIMKQDYCEAMGTASMKQQLQQADRHENIRAHVLLIDSPGGTVDGTKDFADAIKATTKPVVAYVDGLAASAAYWIASSANEIVASNDTTMLGSIGTMISLRDNSKWYEEMGLVEHHIFADKSKDKNRTYLEALEGNYKPIKEQSLNPINEIFLAAVRANRPDVDASTLTGKVFLAQDAVGFALADHVGDFEFALARLQALSPNSQNPISQTTNSNMFTKNKFPKLSALANQEALSDEALEAASAELEAAGISNATIVADATLEEMTANNTRLSTELATANSRISEMEVAATTASETIATLTAERDAAVAQAAEYGAKPGAEHTEPVKPEGDQLEEDPNQSLIDNLPHNKVADESI